MAATQPAVPEKGRPQPSKASHEGLLLLGLIVLVVLFCASVLISGNSASQVFQPLNEGTQTQSR